MQSKLLIHAETVGFQIVGYFDGSIESGTIINGYPVMGNDDNVEESFSKGLFDYIIVCIGYNNFNLKERVFNRSNKSVPMTSIIYPSAIVNHTAHIRQNVLISDGAIIGKDCVLEDNVTIQPGVWVVHNGHIGSPCFLAGRVALAGCVTIGEKCFIGVNCSLRDRISIGDGVTVGIGCVVINNVEDNDIVVGNPHCSIAQICWGSTT